MTLAEYESITGITVSASDQTRVTAEIARSRRKLESLLGFTLDPAQVNTNYYQELGKTSSDFSCPIIETEDLEAPDAVVTAYRLFNYNPLDSYLHIDPFTTINKVKLVYVKQGASPNGITVKTFEDKYIREHQGQYAWSKYIQEYPNWYGWCTCGSHYLQLAVDAVWQFATIPAELNEVWADTVTYYSDTDKDLKSESILTHSYTKFDRTAPSSESYNSAVLGKYAGPHGSLSRNLVA